MGFILDLGPTDVAGLLNASQSMLRGPPASKFIGLFIKNSNFQVSPCDPLDQNLQGWSLGICILPPPPVTLTHSRAIGALVLGGGGEGRHREELI